MGSKTESHMLICVNHKWPRRNNYLYKTYVMCHTGISGNVYLLYFTVHYTAIPSLCDMLKPLLSLIQVLESVYLKKRDARRTVLKICFQVAN